MLLLWNILICLLWPVLYFHPQLGGTLRRRLGNFELGAYDPQTDRMKVLINAVSAGEVNAIAPFIRELRGLRPNPQIVLLTTTDSGFEMAEAKLRGLVELITYFPLIDLPFASRRLLDRLRPDVYMTTESELWPNIQSMSQRRGIRTVLVNGRLYLHNKTGLRWLITRGLLAQFDLIVCQDERQRGNFITLGLPPEQLAVSGNIKFDFVLPEWSPEQLQQWRARLGLHDNVPVIVCGSTHTGEEEQILAALADPLPARIILAPRHLERLPEVEELCRRRGLRYALLSAQEAQAADWDVLIVDRYGVLVDCYRVADLVIMGGTFHPKVGGHNILEATALGQPVVVGPQTWGITAQVELLTSVGAVEQVHSAAELKRSLAALLADPQRRARMGSAGLHETEANHGAALRAVQQVLKLL